MRLILDPSPGNVDRDQSACLTLECVSDDAAVNGRTLVGGYEPGVCDFVGIVMAGKNLLPRS